VEEYQLRTLDNYLELRAAILAFGSFPWRSPAVARRSLERKAALPEWLSVASAGELVAGGSTVPYIITSHISRFLFPAAFFLAVQGSLAYIEQLADGHFPYLTVSLSGTATKSN
jgi:hypothetical protein